MSLDALVFRDVKGAPLTKAEADNNVRLLRDAIADGTGLVVTSWVQDPITMAITLTMSNGQVIGPIALASQPFQPRGTWLTATDYLEHDLVTRNGSSYLAISNHTSAGFDVDLAAGKWQLVAAGGGPGYVDCGDWDVATAYTKGQAVYAHDADTKLRLWIALKDIVAGVVPGAAEDNGWGTLAIEGTAVLGGGTLQPVMIKWEKLGTLVANGRIGYFPVPYACELVSSMPVLALLGVPPGAGKSVTFAVKVNGVSKGTATFTGTDYAKSIAIDLALSYSNIITIELTDTANPGVAADLTVLMHLQPD